MLRKNMVLLACKKKMTEVVYHRYEMDRQVDLSFSAENYCSYMSRLCHSSFFIV